MGLPNFGSANLGRGSEEVDQLFGAGGVVAQQAAHRLLSFEGSEAAYQVQQKIPKDIFPIHPELERLRQDPCTSGFSWSAEDCVECLSRRDLPVEYVARQISRYCIDPALPVPDDLKSQFGSLLGRIDAGSVSALLGPTEADLLLETYEPALAAFAPASLAEFIRALARQVSNRGAAARRQLSIELRQYYLLLGPEERKLVHAAWTELIASSNAWSEAEKTAEMFLFALVPLGFER